MTTLCVVDMQTDFETAKKCLDEVCHQVKLAKRRNAGIVILEYQAFGPTLDAIKKILKRYRRKIYVQKCCDGGGREFLCAAAKKKFTIDRVRFVGVNRSYCVNETIVEVKANSQTEVEIALKATWCWYPSPGRLELKRLGKLI